MTVPLESKETQLGSRDKQTLPSEGTKTRVVVLPYLAWKCKPTAIFGGMNIL